VNWYNEFDEDQLAKDNPTFVRTAREDDMMKLADVLGVPDVIRITYVVGSTEPLHPDPTVCARMREIGLSNCEYGCKVYADPRSNVRVLAHNRSYGCPK
jgi:hypothetical protein